ncbi:MAG TPA: DUF3311 domain-containing protein [Blastocatellia bacterium]|nr:DUF3311 domain-containing protein [Blastocatellia bacterium]HMX24492.1 DUF3311 domain-containing protein [Blastocatellia bacterium]HMY70410.1 DUF3311 domain-containing protein [Blastocatellia bacterium]HMZ18370.1 DUF3311 domain-containing protein [Blastocatellia bacterium]HNG30065.1 DUF3311 domain-containing protein [Blastocatellia bacterium]
MKQFLLTLAVAALYILHQDFWFWREARPLVLGFLPIGLFYHLIYTLAVVALMWLLVKFAWPSHLETESAASNSPSGGSQ